LRADDFFLASSTGSHRGISARGSARSQCVARCCGSPRRGLALNQLLQIIQLRALLLGSFGGQSLVVALNVVQCKPCRCASNRVRSLGVSCRIRRQRQEAHHQTLFPSAAALGDQPLGVIRILDVLVTTIAVLVTDDELLSK
jgi:hypothetical protein